MTPANLIEHLRQAPTNGPRRLVAIAGPPASGKSTFAEQVAASDPSFAVVPMDGFHLDNTTLDALQLRHRKGAPNTFDVTGFVSLLEHLRSQADVRFPLFDRTKDATVPNAGHIQEYHTTVLVEGNYLLLNRPGWQDLASLWDVSVFLRPTLATLETRLVARWRHHGFSFEDAKLKARENDLPNARTVLDNSLPADIYIPT